MRPQGTTTRRGGGPVTPLGARLPRLLLLPLHVLGSEVQEYDRPQRGVRHPPHLPPPPPPGKKALPSLDVVAVAILRASPPVVLGKKALPSLDAVAVPSRLAGMRVARLRRPWVTGVLCKPRGCLRPYVGSLRGGGVMSVGCW